MSVKESFEDAMLRSNDTIAKADRVLLWSYMSRGDTVLIQQKLEEGMDADCILSNGMTALAFAVEKSASNIVDLLIAKGADPLRRGEDGRTALDIARLSKNASIVVAVEAAAAYRCLPLMDCIVERDHAGARALLQKSLLGISYPLEWPCLKPALLNGDTAMLKLLITWGATAKAADIERLDFKKYAHHVRLLRRCGLKIKMPTANNRGSKP